MKKFLSILAISGLLFVSCSDDDPTIDPVIEPTPVTYTSGSADFSNYVAMGNSLTSGYSDGALFIDGQTASLPNMLAANFELAGGGPFTIPYMADNLGGATLGGTPILGNRLILDFSSGSPTPTPVSGSGSTEISNVLSGPFNNMGVPGAKIFHLVAPGYGNVLGVVPGLANPYYARFATSPTARIIDDVLMQNPTFFSLLIGNNDILSYAISGGTGVDQTGNPDPTTYGSNDITDPTVLYSICNDILAALTANGAGGIVANVPDVTSIPFFTTVPHNPVPLDEATTALLNGAYAEYNGGLAQLQGLGLISEEELAQRTISFTAGSGNAVVILDEYLTDLTSFNDKLINMRQATSEDLLVFTSQTIIGTLADPSNPTSINGVAVPLEDQWVLTPEEQEAISTALTAYNQFIEALANDYDLAFVDVNAFLATFAETGFPLADGSSVTATYGTGGGFSLDGIHPSPRGYALLANLFIETINAKYGSDLPGVNPLDYTGLYIN